MFSDPGDTLFEMLMRMSAYGDQQTRSVFPLVKLSLGAKVDLVHIDSSGGGGG